MAYATIWAKSIPLGRDDKGIAKMNENNERNLGVWFFPPDLEERLAAREENAQK